MALIMERLWLRSAWGIIIFYELAEAMNSGKFSQPLLWSKIIDEVECFIRMICSSKVVPWTEPMP